MVERPPVLRRMLAASANNPWRQGASTRLAVGEVPLVAVSADDASVWRLHPTAVVPPDLVPLGANALEAWRHANLALHALPLLWRPLDRLRRAEVAARCLGRMALPGRQAGAEANVGQVDGASFGLSFALAQASSALGRPLPGDLAATATIEPGGIAGAVAGVESKVAALVRIAPGIQRLLVAPGDFALAQAAAAGSAIEVVAVQHLSVALDQAFPNLFEDFGEAGRDAEQQKLVLGCLLDLAWGNRGQVRDWEPIRRTADRALTTWPVGEIERKQLVFVQAVALRHEGRAVDLPPPAQSDLLALPQPRRTEYLAHLVQNAADSGQIDTADLESLATSALPDDWGDCFDAHLRLHGALARLWAVTGRAQQALDRAEESTTAWLARRLPHDAAYPLAVWLRLAGALRDTAALGRARAARLQIDAAVELSEPAYLDLAEAQGALALGDDESADALLRKIDPIGNARLPDHVRFSALRHWLRCPMLDGNERLNIENELKVNAKKNTNAARFLLLAKLDEGDAGEARSVIDDLSRVEPQRIGQLLRFAPESANLGEYLARFYPY